MHISTYFYQYSVLREKLALLHFSLIDPGNFELQFLKMCSFLAYLVAQFSFIFRGIVLI